jgi:peptidyl-prolyl cis-trans isomerase-like protein 2
MVKHQKEKQYQSAREHRENGKSRAGTSFQHNVGSVQKTLPFACCALTLTPFETPVCLVVNDDADDSKTAGSVIQKYAVLFDNAALMQFVLKNQRDPVTGHQLKSSQIIRLHMDQDGEGRWQCPILTKPFADHTKIVAVLDKRSSKSSTATEAYVYSYEAYQELNAKPKNWYDLTTGHKFHPKKDVLLLNDPDNQDLQLKRDINKFWHIQHNRSKLASGTSKPSVNIQKSVTATRIMEQIEKERQQKAKDQKAAARENEGNGKMQPLSLYQKMRPRNYKVLAKDVTGVQYTSGAASRSLTSTSMDVSHQNDEREATEEEILQSYFRILKTQKKGEKGYVKLVIQFDMDKGTHPSLMKDFVEILVELHCDIAPRTCMNFVGLCQQQQYDGTGFHRIIPNFMMQGGKALNGKQDQSLWGTAFVDEFDDRLTHNEAGILSMANAGSNTNLQQFFITFKACPHLDRKHSIFGQVVDGMDRLVDRMKQVKTDKKDRPMDESIKIATAEIISDPIQEVQDQEDERLRALASERIKAGRNSPASGANKKRKSLQISSGISNAGSGIGKYFSSSKMAKMIALNGLEGDTPIEESGEKKDVASLGSKSGAKKPAHKPLSAKFGDFSTW